MYADRYGPKPLDRGSLTLSVTIVGGLVAAAMLSNTVIRRELAGHDLTTYAVPPPPPPPAPERTKPPKQHQQQPAEPRIDQQPPIVDTRLDDTHVMPPDPGPPVILDNGAGSGTGVVIDPPKPPPPVLRGADVDGRYARDFQPVYPTDERRAGHEGVVTLRVLIGIDGRVREVERIAAASDAFWRVTQERALGKWRFRPATRDGVPYKSWKTMTVRFRLEEE